MAVKTGDFGYLGVDGLSLAFLVDESQAEPFTGHFDYLDASGLPIAELGGATGGGGGALKLLGSQLTLRVLKGLR